MRKKYLLGAVVSALALVFAAVAIASPQFTQTAKVKYTTSKAKKPTGLSANLSATDPGASPPGNQPGATKVVINFKGAKANTKAGKRCTLSKSQAAACPASTRIDKPGSGKATANLVATNPSTGQTSVVQGLNNTVKAYLHTGGIYLVVQGTSLPTTVILDASLSKKGKLRVNVARDVPAPAPGQKIVLTSLKLKVKKVTKGTGSKRKALLTTPKCGASKRFKIVTKFNYDDGTSKTITSKQKCKK